MWFLFKVINIFKSFFLVTGTKTKLLYTYLVNMSRYNNPIKDFVYKCSAAN